MPAASFLMPRSVAAGTARNEARSGRISLARLEVRSDLEQLFGSAWSGKEAGPVLLLPRWKRPGMEPGVLPSGSNPAPRAREATPARLVVCEATARRGEETAWLHSGGEVTTARPPSRR